MANVKKFPREPKDGENAHTPGSDAKSCDASFHEQSYGGGQGAKNEQPHGDATESYAANEHR